MPNFLHGTVRRGFSPHLSRVGMLGPAAAALLLFGGTSFSIARATTVALILMVVLRGRFGLLVDWNALLLFCFGLTYTLVSLFDAHLKAALNLQVLVLPGVAYLAGRWLGFRAAASTELLPAFLLIACLLALPALLAIWQEVSVYGFAGGSRSVALIRGQQESGATVLAGTLVLSLALVGVIFVRGSSLKVMPRILLLALALVSTLAAIRLGSRTSLVILLTTIAVGLLLAGGATWTRKAALIALTSATGYVGLEYLSDVVDVFQYYQDRLDGSSEYSAASAGGRLEKWRSAFYLLPTHPLGWPLAVNGFAHNLWLDAARNGGWPSLAVLLVLTLSVVRSLSHAFHRNRMDPLFRSLIGCGTAGCLLLFLVEPIFDGFIYPFSAFSCLCGAATSYGRLVR